MALLKDSAIYLGGEILSKVVPFILIPYLSRKLGVEGYGELSYYQTYIALFVIFLGLSQDGAIARYFYFYGKRSLPLVINSGIIYTLIISFILLCIIFFLRSTILIWAVFSALFQSLLSAQLSIRQCQKKASSYALIQIIYSVLSLIITILFLEIFESNLVEMRIIALSLATTLSFCIAYILYMRDRKIKIFFNVKKYKIGILYILVFGIPLIFHNMSFFIKGQVDRFFIYHQFSSSDLGLYSMGANLASIFSVLIMAVNKASIPYYYELLKNKKMDIKKIYKIASLSLLFIPLPSIVIYLIPESFFLLLLGNEYSGVKYFFSIFVLSNMLLIPYVILVNYIFYFGYNKIISYCSIISTTIYLLSLFVLIEYGINYVPISSVISSFGILPVLFLVIKRINEVRINE